RQRYARRPIRAVADVALSFESKSVAEAQGRVRAPVVDYEKTSVELVHVNGWLPSRETELVSSAAESAHRGVVQALLLEQERSLVDIERRQVHLRAGNRLAVR